MQVLDKNSSKQAIKQAVQVNITDLKQSFYYKSFICKINFPSSRSFSKVKVKVKVWVNVISKVKVKVWVKAMFKVTVVVKVNVCVCGCLCLWLRLFTAPLTPPTGLIR